MILSKFDQLCILCHARALVRVFRFSDRERNRTAQAAYTPKRYIHVKCSYYMTAVMLG